MDKQQYEQAKYCFDKAGFSLESDIAQAYLQQEAAVTAEEFEDTAQLFQSCAELSPDGGISRGLLLTSAMCYGRAGNLPKSAQLYHDAFEYTKCVLQYRKASMMEAALDVTRGHREDIDGIVLKNVCTHFLDLGKYEYALSILNSPIFLLLNGSLRKARSRPIPGSGRVYSIHEVPRSHSSPRDVSRVLRTILRSRGSSPHPRPYDQSNCTLLPRPESELCRAWDRDPP